MIRLKEKYTKEIVPTMVESFSYSNSLAVPRLDKITVSMGVGEVISEAKRLDAAAKDLALITGQKPIITKAKKSVAGFRLREGVSIGCKVTLRGDRMYEFFDRLISIVIPRIRDFRGFPEKSFDGRGNYSLGLSEQIVFPEISIDNVDYVQGMNVTVTIAKSSDEESLELMQLFGFPFRR